MNVDFNLPLSIEIQSITEESFYTEGPVVDSNLGLYFSNITGGQISYWQKNIGVKRFEFDGWPNGQIPYKTGLLVCDCQNRRLTYFDPKSGHSHSILSNHCAGYTIESPNDLIQDSSGGIYFTDSIRYFGKVFYIDKNQKEYLVADEIDYPNGLVLSKNESTLFVAESYKNRILKIELIKPGVSSSIHIFNNLPSHPSVDIVRNLPDGLAIDLCENIWVAHYGMSTIQVLDKNGKLLKSIPTEINLTSNLCFTSQNSLFVTGGNGEPGPGKINKIMLRNV